MAREEGDSKRLHNYNFDAPSMCGGLSTCGRLGFGSVARQTGKAAEVAEKLGKLCGEKCLGGGNNVEIVPFGYFTKPRVKCVVGADPQERGMKGMGVMCGNAAPCVGHKMKGRGM